MFQNTKLTRNLAKWQLCLVFLPLTSCSDSFTDPSDRIWYPKYGLIIVKKAENEKNFGKWKYYCKDSYNEILIRSNENWNVGDTLRFSK